MRSDLITILAEQQAFVLLLSSRLLNDAGQVNGHTFDTFARGLFAHLSVLSNVVIPNLPDRDAGSRLTSASDLTSSSLAHAVMKMQSTGLASSEVTLLTASTAGLIAVERTLIPLSVLGVSAARQQELGALAEEVFARTVGPEVDISAAALGADLSPP